MKTLGLATILAISLLAFPLWVSTAASMGNSAPTTPAEVNNTVKDSDLMHHNFVILSVDGVDFAPKSIGGQSRPKPKIEFAEGFRMHAKVCNNINGQAELKNGILKVEKAASTLMLCADEDLDQLENIFKKMLEEGAEISLQDGKLTLKTTDHILIYELKDYVS